MEEKAILDISDLRCTETDPGDTTTVLDGLLGAGPHYGKSLVDSLFALLKITK